MINLPFLLIPPWHRRTNANKFLAILYQSRVKNKRRYFPKNRHAKLYMLHIFEKNREFEPLPSENTRDYFFVNCEKICDFASKRVLTTTAFDAKGIFSAGIRSGTSTHCAPARHALSTPAPESSSTQHSRVATPSRAAARRYISGSGLPRLTRSPLI